MCTEIVVEAPDAVTSVPGGNAEEVNGEDRSLVRPRQERLPADVRPASDAQETLRRPANPERARFRARRQAHAVVHGQLDGVGSSAAAPNDGSRVAPAADDDLVADLAEYRRQVDVDVVAGGDCELEMVVLVVGALPDVLVAEVVRRQHRQIVAWNKNGGVAWNREVVWQKPMSSPWNREAV